MKQKYQSLVNQTIPISKEIGWHIKSLSAEKITANVELQPNINIHGTGFAGSLFAAAMATGWTLLKCWQDTNQFKGELVAAEANIQYKRPVPEDFECISQIETGTDQYKKLNSRLSASKSCGFMQAVEIHCQSKVCAILNIQFVFKC